MVFIAENPASKLIRRFQILTREGIVNGRTILMKFMRIIESENFDVFLDFIVLVSFLEKRLISTFGCY